VRHRSLALILILFAAALPLRAQEDVPEVARSLMEDAARARDAGRIDAAIAGYRRVIQAAPQLASAYVNLGALLHKQGKIEDAYATFAQGVERAPSDRTLLSNAAATALEIGKSDEALTYIDRAIETNKRDAELYTLRGTVLRALKRDDEAVAALQQAVQLAPNDARAHFSLGNALYAVRRKDDAIAEYRKAIELDPKMTRAYYNLGAVLFDVGRDNEALGAYKVALDPIDRAFAKNEPVDAIHARAYANLGAIYLRQKMWQPAENAYNKAIRLDPSSAGAHYNLGFIFYSTSKFERAEEEYRKALTLDPALPLAYLHLAQMAMKKNDPAGAAKLLRDGLPRFDADTKPLALRTLARAELARGNTADAMAALRQNAGDADSMVLLARLDRRERNFDEARKVLESASSDDAAVLLGRALLARDTNDLIRERAAFEALIAKSPRPEFRVALAANLARQGLFDDARKELDLAGAKTFIGAAIQRDVRELQEHASDPIARGDLGLLLWQSNRADDARPHLAAALAASPAWSEVALASGEMSMNARDYNRAAELLTIAAQQCQAPVTGALIVGKTDDLCTRAKRDLAGTLIAQAATARNGRALVDRAAELDDRVNGVAFFLRATYDLIAGSEDDARTALNRAVSIGLPPAAESAAKKYLAAIAENAAAAERVPEKAAVASAPRRTVVVFLPDAPAENEKKLVETMSSFVTQLSSASGVPLNVEFFRRAEDAREFVAANRERVGVMISNPELVGDLEPQFQFTRDGARTYRRVVIVAQGSAIKSMTDLRGHTLTIAEGLRDVTGSGATIVPATDDLTAAANVMIGKSDAALVSEANALLAQNRGKLRVIHTTGATPMPVVAFAAMPQSDRDALTAALRAMSATRLLANLQVTGLAAIEREPRPTAKRIEVTALTPRDLGVGTPPPPPANVALRATLPTVTISEEIFDSQ
jgi:tetratricopeptide (TPR) repeat protein